jgi:hypothetical protein
VAMGTDLFDVKGTTRNEAKRRAVELLAEGSGKIEGDSPQNHPQSEFLKNEKVQ